MCVFKLAFHGRTRYVTNLNTLPLKMSSVVAVALGCDAISAVGLHFHVETMCHPSQLLFIRDFYLHVPAVAVAEHMTSRLILSLPFVALSSCLGIKVPQLWPSYTLRKYDSTATSREAGPSFSGLCASDRKLAIRLSSITPSRRI